MEYHKGIMKTSLSENLRSLMVKKLFEKITIKQICDETGVIRATFYNYFDDKYDCLNWIVYRDIVEAGKEKIEQGKILEAMNVALRNVEENRPFYRVAYNVTGQNSFEDMVRNNLTISFQEFFRRYRKPGFLSQYDDEVLAKYYAESIAFTIRLFVFERGIHNVEETTKMIHDLAIHTFMDFCNTESGRG